MDDFSKVKVGDKLWSPIFRWGEVTEKRESTIEVLSKELKVEYSFDFKGRYCSVVECPQSLFFEEMTLSPKPKEEEIKPFDPNKSYQRRDGKPCKIVRTTKDELVVVVPENSTYYCEDTIYSYCLSCKFYKRGGNCK